MVEVEFGSTNVLFDYTWYKAMLKGKSKMVAKDKRGFVRVETSQKSHDIKHIVNYGCIHVKWTSITMYLYKICILGP